MQNDEPVADFRPLARGACGRQTDGKGGALVRHALQADGTAQPLDDASDRRQSEASTSTQILGIRMRYRRNKGPVVKKDLD